MKNSNPYLFNHAIVIGGSVAGLMAAKVLASHFQKVTILDRDEMPEGAEFRKRVPQGAHVHALMEAGRHIMEKYYPGLFDEITHAGANLVDTGDRIAWFHHGVWKPRYESEIKMLLCTRPFLESSIRRRTQATPNINFLMEADVEDLLFSPDNKLVTGIVYRDKNNGSARREIYADLVVDASGRASLTPTWLSSHGYEAPQEEHIGIDLSYTTCMFEKPKTFQEDWKFLVHYPKTPETWRAGFISCVENNQWLVSLNGYFKDRAPTNIEGFMEFARNLPRTEIFSYINEARPISDIRIHQIPSSCWRHYDALPSFPENLINLGDSVCAFNPIYGQGMTVAAKGVSLLDKLLNEFAHASPGNLKGFSNQYRKSLPSVIKLPWFLATVLDLKYPQAKGRRPVGHGFLSWYVGKLFELSSLNVKVYHEFLKVLHLKEGIWTILKPGVSLRVLTYGFKSLFSPLEKRANTKTMPYELGERKSAWQVAN
jgi:2-polyprenyl-6-methoxyphenol hydroxylase-like FAD-dependent oxidoreductase